MTMQYGACALHTGKPIDTLSICNTSASMGIGYANAQQYYVTRTLPVIYFDVKVKVRAEITKR